MRVISATCCGLALATTLLAVGCGSSETTNDANDTALRGSDVAWHLDPHDGTLDVPSARAVSNDAGVRQAFIRALQATAAGNLLPHADRAGLQHSSR